MTAFTLTRRSLQFHARSHLGALMGAAVGTAVLLGALLVGDSVRGSLRDMALSRLGATRSALASNDRFFRRELGTVVSGAVRAPMATALQVAGMAVATDGA